MSITVSRSAIVLCMALILLVATACQPVQPVQEDMPGAGAEEASGEMTEEEAKIHSAMSAAPAAIAANATILDWPAEEGGEPVLLREGSNGWMCLPDNAGTPGVDPMCVDGAWAGWMSAYMMGAEPETTFAGISYMLAGGSDPSNTDPYAMEPAAGEEWVTSPAHIMVLVPGGFDPAVFSTDPDSGGPYIMWEGTPYEHLMVPVDAGM